MPRLCCSIVADAPGGARPGSQGVAGAAGAETQLPAPLILSYLARELNSLSFPVLRRMNGRSTSSSIVFLVTYTDESAIAKLTKPSLIMSPVRDGNGLPASQMRSAGLVHGDGLAEQP